MRLPTRVTGYTITARNDSERLALARILGLGLSDSLDPELLRNRLRQVGQTEAYQAIWLAPRGASDSVSLHVTVRRSPRRVAGLGLAYDNELGGRMWVGAVDRRLLDFALEGSAAGFLGELRKELHLGFRRHFQVGRQLVTPVVTARLASESVRQFTAAGDELNPLKTREAFGFGGAERAFLNGWQAALGVVAHAWEEPGGDRSTLGATLRMVKEDRTGFRAGEGSLLWAGQYRRIAVTADASARIGPLRLRPRVRFGWGEDLPLQSSFPLGGEDGFPGLHIGERRGDRELLVDLLMTYPLKGPFVARLELAAGRSGSGGPAFATDDWLAGGRIGLGAETPVGPVRFEYGLSGNRDAFFLRLGRWF